MGQGVTLPGRGAIAVALQPFDFTPIFMKGNLAGLMGAPTPVNSRRLVKSSGKM